MKKNPIEKALEALLVVLLAISQFVAAFWAREASRRIDRIESSCVTQERLDSVLTDIFD